MGRVSPLNSPLTPRWVSDCLYTRADALFELTDAVLCSDGPVTSQVELPLTAEHRRGYGATACLHAAAACRRRRIALPVDVSNWLRPDGPTSPEPLFCHVYGRGRSADQFIPGWPYSFVAALETGRTSWTAEVKRQAQGRLYRSAPRIRSTGGRQRQDHWRAMSG